MNATQYRNIIDNTMKCMNNKTKADSVKTAVEIFKNRGIEFPDESLDYVKEILNSDNYMSWEHCESFDVQDYANNGKAVVGINNDRVVVIAPESDSETGEKYPNVLPFSELTEDDILNMSFYSATYSYYGGGTIIPEESTLDKLKKKFPHEKYWNNVDIDGNNADGYTDKPCPSHSSTKTCNIFKHPESGEELARQCIGFAAKCAYDATGTVYTKWTRYTSDSALSRLKPGDIITYYTDSTKENTHSIYVTGVNDDTITYGDCNGMGSKYYCIIQWDRTRRKSGLKGIIKSIWSAPEQLDV